MGQNVRCTLCPIYIRCRNPDRPHFKLRFDNITVSHLPQDELSRLRCVTQCSCDGGIAIGKGRPAAQPTSIYCASEIHHALCMCCCKCLLQHGNSGCMFWLAVWLLSLSEPSFVSLRCTTQILRCILLMRMACPPASQSSASSHSCAVRRHLASINSAHVSMRWCHGNTCRYMHNVVSRLVAQHFLLRCCQT